MHNKVHILLISIGFGISLILSVFSYICRICRICLPSVAKTRTFDETERNETLFDWWSQVDFEDLRNRPNRLKTMTRKP